MKKLAKISLSFLLSISLLITPGLASATSFSDLSSNHARSTAINFLKDNGIINGYEDGTFRPNQKVNRAEFLKIVMESSNIPLDITAKTGFLDLDENAWYGPYFKKAKHEKWIVGYEGNVAKPANQINKVEALKIIAEVQQWQLRESEEISEAPYKDTPKSSWYIRYVDFAKSKGILEKKKSKVFPAKSLTRADIADLLYLTIIKEVSNFTPKTETKEVPIKNTIKTPIKNAASKADKPKSNTEALNFTPVTFKSLGTSSFDQITLNEKLPNTFYKNEVYFFEGKTSSSKNDLLAFLSYEKNGEIEYINTIGKVNSNGSFSLPITFSETGNYNIGIIPGLSGTSKVYKISVLPSLPQNTSGSINQAANNSKIEFSKDKTSISWDKNDNNLFKVNLWQNDEIVTYFNRQGKNHLAVNYKDFENFSKGTVNFDIESAISGSTAPLTIKSPWQVSQTAKFQAITHMQSDLEEESIHVTGFKDILPTNQTIKFKGTTKTKTNKEAAIIRPDGFVDKVDLISGSNTSQYFGSQILDSKSTFTFKYKPAKTGTYIIEINKQNGAASVNKPVYIGNGIPLIPDYFDLENESAKPGNVNLNSARQELLKYINQARSEHGLNKVEINEELNNLAQLHSKDMVDSNYFGHINLQGQSPTDRRKALGINTVVGENLSQAPGIRYGHEGLMRSAVHRENILDPSWDRVGLGIVKNKQGYFVITEEFSRDPYKQSDLDEFESELFNSINQNRNEKNLQKVVKNSTLDKITETFGKKLLSGDQITSGDLTSEFQTNGINHKSGFVVNGSSSDNQQIIKQMKDAIDSSHSQWKEIGINYNIDKFGTLIFVILYTN